MLVRWFRARGCLFLARPPVPGPDRVPRRGAVILAANHRAAVDTAAIALTAGRPVSFLGKAEYFTGRGLPEGTRSLDGRLHRGHTGVATLALDTGAVVVPVALVGTERVQPIGARFPRLHRVTVRYGEPLDFARYDGLSGSTMIRRAVTDEVMAAIATLSKQEYVDRYHERPAA